MRSVLVLLAAGLSIVSGITAQRTWIVDAAGGPGTDFRDLPPAMVAASSGDKIQIRAGAYTSATTIKPLRLVGEPGALVSSNVPLRVERLPAGTMFEIVGLQFQGAFNGFEAADNRGVITVHDVGGASIFGNTIVLENCDYVALSGALANIVARDSTLSVSDAIVTSRSFARGALGVGNCTTFLSHAILTGGPSSTSGNPLADGPGNGITAIGGRLRIAATCAVRAGPSIGQNSRSAAGLQAFDCDMTIDPAATFVGTRGPGLVVGSGAAPRRVVVPGLGVSSAPPGGGLQARLSAPSGTPVVIAASGRAVLAQTVLGDLVLDPAGIVTIGFGTTDAQDRFTVGVAVPSDAALRGTPLHFQGAAGLRRVELTTPASAVVE